MKQVKLFILATTMCAASLAIISCHTSSNNAPAAVFDCATMSSIKTNTTLAKGNYTIACNIDVSNNAVYTIAPGSILNFNAGYSLTVESGAAISAAGTSANPIVFKGSQATQGYWNGIYINSISLSNVFSYCTISDAGAPTSSTFGANVTMANASASFTNCTISNSKDAGIFMTNAAPDVTVFNAFTNNTISGNNSYPLILFAAGAASLGTGNTFTANTNNYIGIRDQSNTGTNVNITFNPQSVPYLFMQTGSDYGVRFTKSLIIMPGTTIAMASGTNICVTSTGSISAIGTATNPIIIKGQQPTAGFWGSVFVQSNNSSNSISYCTVSDGGALTPMEFNTTGGLITTYEWIDNNRSIAIRNCAFSNSSTSGISLTHRAGYTVTYNADIATSNTFSGCSPNIVY
jgi:hypothetical protein